MRHIHSMDLHNFRSEYLLGGLSRKDLCDDPIQQFEAWMQQAIEADIREPSAMVVATVDQNNQPSQRIVLLKQLDQRGFVFFTDTSSSKGRELSGNSQASLLFPWHMLERQVHVRGIAELLPRDEVETYFHSRPLGSQVAASISEQSQAITSRAELLERYEAANKTSKEEVALPDRWGGYRIVPQTIEFWQGGEHRLHDRFHYKRTSDNNWTIRRLQP